MIKVIPKTRKEKKPFRRLKDQKQNYNANKAYKILKSKINYILRLIKHNKNPLANFIILQSTLSQSKNIMHINRRSRIISKAQLLINKITKTLM